MRVTKADMQRYARKGLNVKDDRRFTASALAKLKIIRGYRGEIAGHQFIRLEMQKGRLNYQEEGGSRPGYVIRTSSVKDVLNYLNRRGIL